MTLRALSIVILLVLLRNTAPTAAKDSYELRGKVLQIDGNPFHGVVPVVFLQGATAPFSTRTVADRAGHFRFKGLAPETYTLIVTVPRAGEQSQTVEVGPSFADSKRRVELTVLFERKPAPEGAHGVPVSQLAIPELATQEYERALGRLQNRDVPGAVSHLKKAVEIAPAFASAWNHLGTISYQTQNYPEAEKYFREALAQDPDSYSPLVNLGAALFSQGKLAESLAINERAVDARPDDALAHSQLGQSYFRLGRPGEAEMHLKQAKALDPRHFSLPQLVLAQIYERRQDYTAMIAELEELMKYHPDSQVASRVAQAIEAARARLKKAPSSKP